jgi:hypothetical protein
MVGKIWTRIKNSFANSPRQNGHVETADNGFEVLPAEHTADGYPAVYITESLLDRTGEILASFARNKDAEGVVYWFGMESAGGSVITTLIVPNADAARGCIRTSPKANAEAVSAIIGTPLVLIGQAHSHPGTCVGHSDVDDLETFASFALLRQKWR